MGDAGGEIVRADPGTRKKVLRGGLLALVLCLGCVLALVLQFQRMEGLAETHADQALEQLKKTVDVLFLVNALLSIALSAWFFRLAARTLASGRYPPPGTRVFRDTRLRTGGAARVLAALQVVVAVLLLSTNLVMLSLQRLLDNLGG